MPLNVASAAPLSGIVVLVCQIPVDGAGMSSNTFDIQNAFNTVQATAPGNGILFSDHKQALTALPRVSLNSEHQSLTCRGAPFAIWNGFHQVNAA